jgi:hypothetical protein
MHTNKTFIGDCEIMECFVTRLARGSEVILGIQLLNWKDLESFVGVTDGEWT